MTAMFDGSRWQEVLIEIGVILAIALVLTRVVIVAVRRFSARVEASDGSPGQLQRRAQTLASVMRSGLLLFVWIVATVSILSQAGVAVGPILAAAGIAGVALGLGAQHLVRDFLGGFFILLENQYDVGDVVELGTVSGTVEAVNLRTTVLRAEDGARHVVPNGEVRVSSNLTKAYSRYMLTIPVPYGQDVDHAIATARAVADEMAAEEPYRRLITRPFRVLGVDAYGAGGVEVSTYVETLPGEQWTVGRELRRRLAAAFAREGIPFSA
jgi:small conductance mechanosensitive channel